MRAPMGFEYEMTFAERIEGPLGPTTGSPARLCWKIAEATLTGPRITASLVMPGIDWIRIDGNGVRRQDQRTQFLANDGTLILMRYDAALIRGDEEFSRALASGRETTFADQYMCMTPQLRQQQHRTWPPEPVHRPRAASRAQADRVRALPGHLVPPIRGRRTSISRADHPVLRPGGHLASRME